MGGLGCLQAFLRLLQGGPTLVQAVVAIQQPLQLQQAAFHRLPLRRLGFFGFQNGFRAGERLLLPGELLLQAGGGVPMILELSAQGIQQVAGRGGLPGVFGQFQPPAGLSHDGRRGVQLLQAAAGLLQLLPPAGPRRRPAAAAGPAGQAALPFPLAGPCPHGSVPPSGGGAPIPPPLLRRSRFPV